MALFEWILKIIFWFWLGVFGIGLADLAMDLQKETIRAYLSGFVKGPFGLDRNAIITAQNHAIHAIRRKFTNM